MQFKIKNNQVYFHDYDLTNYMDIKEINVNVEENETLVVAEFKADIDVKSNAFLSLMLREMSEENLLDLKSELDFALKKAFDV